MKKLFSSKIFMIIIIAVFIVPTVVLNFFMAYIMLAPDNLPKPFYLTYEYPEPRNVALANSEEHGEPSTEQEYLEVNPEAHEATGSISPESAAEIQQGQGITVDTGTKIVNLAEPTGRRYIRVNVVLEFAPTTLEYYSMGEEEKVEYLNSFNEDIESKMPVINDGLISLLSSKSFEDVYTAEGKEAVREEIIVVLNERLPEYQLLFVYFTEFVVQ